MSKQRKGYVVLYSTNDLAHHDTVTRGEYTDGSKLPDGLIKFVDRIQGDDLLALLPEPHRAARKCISNFESYALITRRAAARAIVRRMNNLRIHGRDDFKLLEVGEFDRTVTPVKHWNIERQYRTAKGNWGGKDVWKRGVKLRAEAREIARKLEQSWNYEVRGMGVLLIYKFRAVPVYA